MTQGVKIFLSGLGLVKYHEMFTIKGFDDESDIPYLTAFDLEKTIMITSRSDISTILAHARVYRPSSEHAVYAWLCSNSLGYYFISFMQSELTDLRKIAQLSLPDEELYDELEILLPGHRKRLERAVQRLKLEQVNNTAAEIPVSYGWWGKPECLPQAKFDFLCVRASLFSSQDAQNSATVDFMIDSGSDVSTVQEDTLKKLNLELIGPVYSCGIHGGNHTNLYKGRLKLGDQLLDIEVMGSNYDSLGSRVIRHFRHVIDGHRHIWLRGNYTDPCPAIIPIEFPMGSNPSSQIQHVNQQQPMLTISGAEAADTEIVDLGLDQMARKSGTEGSNITSETQKYQTLPSSDTVSTEHFHCLNPRQTSDSGLPSSKPNVCNSKSPIEVVSLGKMSLHSSHSSHSSPNIPSYNGKYVMFGSKRKNSKSNLKSPQKRKHNYFKPSLHKETLQRFSHSPVKTSAPSTVENHSESLENPSRKDGPSNDRVSLCNILPHTPRDTDDDVDNLEGCLKINMSSSVQNSDISDDNSISMLKDSRREAPSNDRVSLCNILPHTPRDTDDDVDHLEGCLKKGTSSSVENYISDNSSTVPLEYSNIGSRFLHGRFSKSPCDESNHLYQTATNGLKCSVYDIVHINGLSNENMEHDGESSSCPVQTNGDRNQTNMNFIPACADITEIDLDDVDNC